VQIGGTCASGLLVSAGSSCTISVKFTPQMSGGLRSASLAVTYGGSSVENPTAVLSLQGTGSSASSICLSLSAPSTGLNFGTVTPGSLSAPQAVTLTNQGPGVAKLIGMDLSNSVFKIASDNCPWVSGPNGSQTLASGSSCTINYVFNPSAAGSYNAIATFAYQDMAGASYNSSLSLSGVASGPVQRTLSSGDSASCAVKNGAVLCWGLNNKGILGDGSSIRSRSVPSPVSGLDAGVISVAAGVNHACALRNGGVVCWGANDDGSLGDGSTNSSLVPVSVSGMSSGVTAIAAGGNTTCAIQNGALKCWGYNGSGQLGIGSSAASGANSYRAVPTQVNGLTSGVTAVSLSNDNNANKPVNHVCAIHNGAVKCWGSNLYSSVGDFGTADRLLPFAVPGFSSGIQNVVALNNRTCVVKDGALSCWGYGKNGEIGNGVSSTRNPTPVVPSGMDTGVTAVGGSVSTTCAIKAGRLYCWGDNKQGTVGDGSNKDRSVPTPVTSMDSNVEQVGREDAKSVCATKQGQLYCWGYNNKGQLGDGSTNDRAIPGLVYGW
jgi:alpha-tubulin suppressor-like RCC1 family protein